jgi:hypothetical protein
MSYDPAKKQAQTAKNGGDPQSLPSLADAFDISDAQTEAFMNGGWELSPLGTAALSYARRGVAVFPCVSAEPPDPDPKRRKRPLTKHGFKDATTDQAKIHEWWSRWPNANIGCEPGRTGHHLLDIDPANGGNETWKRLVAEHGDIATHEVATPNDGRHLYLKLTGEPMACTQLGPGIDTRGEGGYVLLPPSRILRSDDTGFAEYRTVRELPYETMPEWVKICLLQSATTSDADNFDWEQRRHPDKPLRLVTEPKVIEWLATPKRAFASDSEHGFSVITLLCNQNYSAEEVYGTLAEHDGRRLMGLAHYEEHSSGFENALRADIRRAFDKNKRPQGPAPEKVFRNEGDNNSSSVERPEIRLTGDFLSYAIPHTEAALIAQKVAYYQRGNTIVRPDIGEIKVRGGAKVEAEQLFAVSADEMCETMTKAAVFTKWNERVRCSTSQATMRRQGCYTTPSVSCSRRSRSNPHKSRPRLRWACS